MEARDNPALSRRGTEGRTRRVEARSYTAACGYRGRNSLGHHQEDWEDDQAPHGKLDGGVLSGWIGHLHYIGAFWEIQ